MMGGKRKGAGRKTGSMNIPKLSSFFTDKELRQYIAHLKKRYKKSDKIAVFIGEQLFGKALQALEHSGKNGEAIKIISFRGDHADT